jgi:hypothetical protein
MGDININEYDVDSLRLNVELIEKEMRGIINVIKPRPVHFNAYIETAKKMLEPHYITLITDYDGAEVVRIPIWRKREINVKKLYYEWTPYRINGVRINHHAIREMLRKLAVKHLEYSGGIETYTLNTRDPSTREFIIKLLIYNALYDYLWNEYVDLWKKHLITLSYAVDKLWWNDLYPINDFDQLLRVISKKSIETLRSVIANIAERKIRWLRKKLELHYIVSHAAKKYIKSIIYDPTLNGDRAKRYLRNYLSYVEYDGNVVRYRVHETHYSEIYIEFLSGYEETEKFVRIKMDILRYDYWLRLDTYGSWIIGFDKLTRQPFSISLPYTCVTMPIKPCVEYIFGLRRDNLERINEDVEIYET